VSDAMLTHVVTFSNFILSNYYQHRRVNVVLVN